MATLSLSNQVTELTFNHKTELFINSNQDKFFVKLLVVFLSLYLVFGLIVPFIERVELPREVVEKVPVQLTKVMLQKKEEEVPPPVIVEEEPEIEPPVEEKPKTKREAAKDKAKSSGLAAMKDDLFALREAFVVSPKQAKLKSTTPTQVEELKRNLLSAKANEQSKALGAAKVAKTVTSDDLSTRNTQAIRLAEEEVIASTFDDEDAIHNVDQTRSEVKLRQTLEANKSRLYSVYNRALRKNPFLKGKVLFEIEIQPSGKVSSVIVQSSELDDKALEKRLTSILRTIDFGSKDVAVTTTIWAIEFLPR